MDRSHIVNEEHKFVRFNIKGETKLVTAQEVVPGYNYRRVHYTREGLWTEKRIGNQLFQDPEYQIDKSELSKIDYKKKNVILKRLYQLYQYSPKNQKPLFFPKQSFVVSRQIDHTDLPPFVTEIGIFPIEHYKSLFLTQEFVSHGLYEIIINQNGRFETDVVDDIIPVYEDTLEPIWGMDIQHGWLIILLKFWAKKNKSYLKVKQIPPFQFIEFFTNSNWKYFNLHKQGYVFLDKYVGKTTQGKFVLKTKNTNQVLNAGLIPNSAGYEMISLVQTTGKQQIQKKKWVVTIKSTLVNRWTGQMSVLDKELNKNYNSSQYKMQLQRDFMMSHIDFLNLFSSAYIASRRETEQYFSDYYLISVPPNNKSSIYLKFNITEPGFFDFCIKQFDDTRVPFSNNKSIIRADKTLIQNEDGKRFLKMRYILVRDTTTGQDDENRQNNNDFFPLKFDTYEIQYMHGYNRGDARFETIVPGTYYFKIKPEKYSQETKFVLNYACNTHIQMEQVNLTKQQKGMLLRQAMVSMFDRITNYSLDKNKLYQQIAFANLFEDVGYGFVAIRMKKSCPYKILIQIDPDLVKQSGYKLKNQFKNMTNPFSILVSRGQSTSVVLKKLNPLAQWPPQGIQIFRQI